MVAARTKGKEPLNRERREVSLTFFKGGKVRRFYEGWYFLVTHKEKFIGLPGGGGPMK